MRILALLHSYAPYRGGAQLLSQRVSEELVAQGHQVRVITPNTSSFFYENLGSKRVAAGVEVQRGVEILRLDYGSGWYEAGHVFAKLRERRWAAGAEFLLTKVRRLGDVLLRPLKWRIQRRYKKEVEEELLRYRPDVVMAMPLESLNTAFAIELKLKHGFPLAITPLMHEEDPLHSVPTAKDLLKHADALIAITAHEKDRLIETYGFPGEMIFTSWAGVDAPAQIRAAKRNRVLYFGRMKLYKGLEDLIAAMELVWKDMPDAELCLAGASTDDAPRIKDLLKGPESRHPGRISRIYDISDDLKSELMSSSNCLVFPSLIESFGIVIIESWAHGTPVVAFDFPVLRSYVDHGRDGLLVERGAQALAGGILSLLKDPEKAGRMGEIARQKALARFNWRSVAREHVKAYEYAIQKRRPA